MTRAAAIVLCLVPAPALATETYPLPAGCDGFVTLQKRGCVVTHLYRCGGDPTGLQWRVDLQADGPSFFGAIDAETRWVESHHVRAGRVETLAPGAADPASFSALIETGVDTYDFATRDDAGYETRFVGTDRLTGERVEIDGVVFERTRFEIAATDAPTGALLWEGEGSEFIQRDWRSFVSGTSRYTLPDESYESDRSPVEVHFPGEEGFLSSRPKYDCGLMISLAPASPERTP